MGVGCSKPTATEPTATQVADPNAKLAMKVKQVMKNAEQAAEDARLAKLKAERAEQAADEKRDLYQFVRYDYQKYKDVLHIADRVKVYIARLQAEIDDKTSNVQPGPDALDITITKLTNQVELMKKNLKDLDDKASNLMNDIMLS